MQLISTAFLIFALVIAVRQDGATAQLVETYEKLDQIAEEGKNRAVTIIDGPKYVTPPQTPAPASTTLKPEKPPNKPPNPPYLPEKHGKPYAEIPRLYYAPVQIPPMRKPYAKPMKVQHTVYKYQKVVPLHPHRNHYHKQQQQQPLVFAASTGKPSVAKSPKFSLPVETINGIRADFVRPPHGFNTTTSTTTTPSTTTARYLRTKRIWPKHILEKMQAVNASLNGTIGNKTEDLHASHSFQRYVYLNRTSTTVAPSTGSTTRAPYRRVTRSPKRSTTTAAPDNATLFPLNDWIPIVPSHYPVKTKVRKFKQTPIYRRSDVLFYEPNEGSMNVKRMLYLHSYGLLPVASSQNPSKVKASHSNDDLSLDNPGRKYNILMGNRGKRPLNLNSLSGYRRKPAQAQSVVADYDTEESQAPQIVTKIKHHHHHHHHRYIKTVEKPVKVEVSKPVPVPVPMPVPVKVEKKVPYPVQVKVPHPVPVKVIQKEYVPKPYPVYQQVPVYHKVEVKVPHPVPVPVEKQVPYPVHVQVPVDRPVPVPVPYEKRVPYPVPVKVLVPQPYPVETKVPVPVKEPVEVVRHVPFRVPYPKLFPVKVPVPVPYEKRVPYPVEVERPVPVPYRVPEKVEVEKKVPVFLPKPYPVEKKVPYPVKVPFPVRVPVRVPVGIPIIVRPSPSSENVASGDVGANEAGGSGFSYSIGNPVTHEPHSSVTFNSDLHNSIEEIGKVLGFTSSPKHDGDSVTVHGRPGFSGFQSRSDDLIYDDETTTSNPVTTTTSTETTTSSSEPTTTSAKPTTTSSKPTTTSAKTATTSSKTTTASTKTTGTRSKTTISRSRTTAGGHFEVIGLHNSGIGEDIAHKPR